MPNKDFLEKRGKNEIEYSVLPTQFPGKYGYHWVDPSSYKTLIEFAKENRSNPTLGEEKLWTLLKTKQVGGHKFRRQHIIGAYIVDFVCLVKKLIIEVDGLIHQLHENKEADIIRTAWLNELGFKVMRFSNNEVLNNTEVTIKLILEELNNRESIKKSAGNNPSPQTLENMQLPTEAPSPREGEVNSPVLENSSSLSSPFGGQGAKKEAESINEIPKKSKPPMKAMILAAGLGTRLKPFTDNHPKALATVSGKTILQRNIEYLASYGIKEVIVNVHHFADQVIAFLKDNNNFGSTISISDETDEVLETGGGIKKAGWFFETSEAPFVVMNVDILTDMNLGKMIAQHQKGKSIATLAVTTRYTSRYFLFDEYDTLCGWKNEKTGERKISREANRYVSKAFSGIQVISPQLLSLIKMKGKFSMVDVYLELAKTQCISSFDHSNSKFIDVGKPESIIKAEKLFR